MATKRQMKKHETKLAMEKATEVGKEKVEKAMAAEEKKTVENKMPEVKQAEEKTVAETKKTVRKTAVKKEIKQKVIVEYQGKQVDTKEMVAAVKKAWTKGKNKVSDIKSMELYVKPEDSAVYYVINGTDTGRVEF